MSQRMRTARIKAICLRKLKMAVEDRDMTHPLVLKRQAVRRYYLALLTIRTARDALEPAVKPIVKWANENHELLESVSTGRKLWTK